MIRIGLALLLAVVVLVYSSAVAYADDGGKDSSDTVIDIGVSGELEVDIKVTGPSELNVGVEGPSEVDIDAGDEVDLNVQASVESEVFIKGQNPDEPAGYHETENNDPGADLDNRSLKLDDYISRLDGHLAIISAVFPIVGLLTFFLIADSIERGQTKE